VVAWDCPHRKEGLGNSGGNNVLMYNPLYFLAALLMLLSVSKLTAQSRQISVSGTYAPTINTINATEVNYTALGLSGEYEYKSRKHFSFGVELDWQKYTPEIVYVEPYQSTNPFSLNYTIHRYQVNLRPIFRFYWKEDFQGLYVGAFGAYSRTITLPKESPKFPGFPSRTIDYAYKSAAGFGITYGYRFKLTSSLRLSILGNHQLVFSDIYDDDGAHQDHQFGLGLNWFWGE
jgi:hypothetical protein